MKKDTKEIYLTSEGFLKLEEDSSLKERDFITM